MINSAVTAFSFSLISHVFYFLQPLNSTGKTPKRALLESVKIQNRRLDNAVATCVII